MLHNLNLQIPASIITLLVPAYVRHNILGYDDLPLGSMRRGLLGHIVTSPNSTRGPE